MLYEGAIRYALQAIEHFNADRRNEGSDRIKRVLDIVHYLTNTLDHEKGGEVAVNLERLYEFVRDTLSAANIESDVEKIQNAIEVLKTLLEGWSGIIDQKAKEVQDTVDPTDSEEPARLRMVG